jgi:hypothetical protein
MGRRRARAAAFWLSIAVSAGLLAPTSAWAGTFSCVTGDPATINSAQDLADLQAMRAIVDGACACDGFTTHRAYYICARDLISQFPTRSACKREAKKIFRKSTCGYSATTLGPRIPCVRVTSSGAIRCTVKTQGRCPNVPGPTFAQTPCPGYDYCVDAADTDGNLVIDGSDTGVCSAPLCGDGVVNQPSEE